MKAQLRLAGGRRKPGRHGFSSDTPGEFGLTVYLRALRDQTAESRLAAASLATATASVRDLSCQTAD